MASRWQINSDQSESVEFQRSIALLADSYHDNRFGTFIVTIFFNEY